MPKSYSLEEVKQRIVDILARSEAGLSGVELAEKTGINRVTITKYLNILESMGLVKRKCVGNVNLWYIQHGLDLSTKNILEIQRSYMDALFNYDERKARAIIINAVHSNVDPVTIIDEVITPTLNTADEFYDRGMMNILDLMIIKNIIVETLDAIKFNVSIDSKHDAYAIFLSIDNDSSSEDDINSRILYTTFYIKGWNSYFIGNVSLAKMSLFFDIEMVKLLNKLFKRSLDNKKDRSLVLLCITLGVSEPIVNEFIRSIKEKFGGSIFILINMKRVNKVGYDDKDKDNNSSSEPNLDSRYVDHYSKYLKDSIEWAERLYRNLHERYDK
jgi:transcriptional regulator with XRE-family HTH domain